jgi:FtsP/CotA-like multicopper oxidase with cupredoxin domain
MQDMGMDHGSIGHAGHNAPSIDHSAMGHTPMASQASPSAHGEHGSHNSAGHEGHTMMNSPETGGPQRHDHPGGPGVANMAMQPTSRLHEPGAGLADVGHRVLVYTDLKSLDRNPDTRPPGREVEVHLTSNMERYMWSFDGRRWSEVVDPIQFYQGERVRLTMVNDTMMPHPIHLHGMFFDVVNGESDHKPRKHTITVKPGEKLSVDVTPEDVGDWAFHCHLLYHMHAGMFQVVSVTPGQQHHQTHHQNHTEHAPHAQHGAHHGDHQ